MCTTVVLLFSFGLGQSQSPSLGPKMNTKVAFNTHPPPPPTTTTHPPTTLNFLTSFRHSRRLKLGIQLSQTKPNPIFKRLKSVFDYFLSNVNCLFSSDFKCLHNIFPLPNEKMNCPNKFCPFTLVIGSKTFQ